MRTPELLLVVAVVAGGCGTAEVRGPRVTDAELKKAGTWTQRDALARALLDHEAPGADLPVRLVPVRRKVITEVVVGGVTIPVPRIDGFAVGPGAFGARLGFLEALLGLDYEKRYHYVASVKGYVHLNRDRPATISSEDPEGTVEAPTKRTPPRAWRELRDDLERDGWLFDVPERAPEPPATDPTIQP
ncbi:MAG: hypothetical protein M9894_20195 [Planctomycetes bacterium]|nr:hypothetical protein [Planctomycetota bacterium]